MVCRCGAVCSRRSIGGASCDRAWGGKQERREIERALLGGELWAVCATNALELGVDVGSLDVTLHLGFPGSIASLWQQARPRQPPASLSVLPHSPYRSQPVG